MREKICKHIPEFIVVIVFIILHIVVGYFHEGCFDEVHAWNIAKDGTLYEILFEIPRYEGHPALWHLIFIPFVSLGISFKAAALIITTFFGTVSVSILEFKSPFPRPIKLLLPFTYFFFYQYGIIARPYCMMVLAFLLIAVLYKRRDEKPVRFTLALLFLCTTSAFGVAVAGGISLVWLIKIFGSGIKRGFKDRRFYCLLLLLVYTLFLLARMLPINTYGGMSYTGARRNGIVLRLLYLTTGLFSDLFFTDSYSSDFLADYVFDKYELACSCIVGAVILTVIIYIGVKRKTIAEFLIPFGMLTIFSTFVYFCIHNSGILFCFLMYWVWISLEKPGDKQEDRICSDSFKYIKNLIVRYKYVLYGVLMVLPLIWSISAGVTDIIHTYSFGEKEAEYIKSNGLENSEICLEWNTVRDESKKGTLEYFDMKHIINMDRLYAYLDNPHFVNWPFSYSLYTFFHRETTDVENTGIIDNIIENPKPDVLIGEPDLSMVNGNNFNLHRDYVLVYSERIVKPWKNCNSEGKTSIFLRRDIAESRGMI